MSLPPIPPDAIEAAKKIVTIVGPIVLSEAKKFWSTDRGSKNRGSKVKRGAFQECAIEMFGDKACIVVNEDTGAVVMLTSDTIRSYHYVKKKKRTVGLARHTYYYYTITFNDGRESYVRMRKKYVEAMERYL